MMFIICNRSGCDREGDIDWHMSYIVTVRLLNPTRSNPIIICAENKPLHKAVDKDCSFYFCIPLVIKEV